jgi:P27 family predicted phage terminase small subunit
VAGKPEPPEHLAGEAREEWARVLLDLAAMGVLGRENRVALAIYCQAWARMVRAERHIAEHGEVVPAPRTGTPMHNPYLSIANRAADTVMKIATEFGLTPSSRSRVGASAIGMPGQGSKSDEADNFEKWLADDPNEKTIQ